MKTLKFFCLVFLGFGLSATTVAEEVCEQPPDLGINYYQGKRIADLARIGNVNEKHECKIFGRMKLPECSTEKEDGSESEDWLCKVGKVLMCRFCPQETKEEQDYISSSFGLDEYSMVEDECERLESAHSGLKRLEMTEEEWNSVREAVLVRLRKITWLITNFLPDELDHEPNQLQTDDQGNIIEKEPFNPIADSHSDDTGFESFKTQRPTFINAMNLYLQESGNPAAMASQMGTGSNTKEMVKKFIKLDRRWVGTHGEVHGATEVNYLTVYQNLSLLRKEIRNLSNEYASRNSKYSPQTSCVYE